ncbi:Ankyrin repeat domain-containing protein 6 [Phytophthora citrophthora]|uniref:Ankyrin repeat domain-containing protein 6 n=1 Tax=Phytophthora citrophthora TaxID=4793 RepID=A0AAD9GQL4_9STRA|nr:Ankyrin repeat domain-containing protein 6 [Phytophthora citrophthora]
MVNRPRKKPVDDVPSKKKAARRPSRNSAVGLKLNAMQLSELLRPFWMELLQNNLKSVKKFLRENQSRVDFNAARYTPCAEGTGLHLCAQHGFTNCAQLLLEFGVKVDLQNKVGSTALHVACKFNQDEMVLFLIDLGARMDIPDLRNNVAFDVAPYTLLDKCLLAPQREKLALEQQEEAQLLEIHQAAVAEFEEMTLAKAHASMVLGDWESCAWEEWEALQTANKMDREWSEQVQRSRQILESKKAMYTDLQLQLEKEKDQIVQMKETVFREAQNRLQRAHEEMERMLMLTEETQQHWMREQQELKDQFGLLQAAQEFPNDADVQHWALCTMVSMLNEAESAGTAVNPHGERVTTEIAELLVREEVILVLRNVLQRFPKVRDLQLSALQCFVHLARHCIKSPDPSRASNFLTKLVKNDVMALSRDVFSRFNHDVEISRLVTELIHRLLQFRGGNGSHGLQFCQNRLSHQLPLQVLRLYESSFSLRIDADPTPDYSFPWSSENLLIARYHASFLLFTLAKYNVRKTLDKDGALPVIRRLLFQLTTSSPGDEEIKASTLRYLIGTLALMNNYPRLGNTSSRSAPWSIEELSNFLDFIRPWLDKCLVSSNESEPTSIHFSLAFWTIKLIRNLTQPLEDEIVQLRTLIRTREMFDLLGNVTLTVRKYKPGGGEDTAMQNIVVVWLEILENIWLCRYNSDGQLAATPAFVMEFLLQLLELEAGVDENIVLVNIAAVLKLLALVLSNAKNVLYLVDQEYKIDVSLTTILKVINNMQSNESVGEVTTMELLAHVLRIYLRFFDYERNQMNSNGNLHNRCRAIGLCATLRAFGLLSSERSSSPEASSYTSSNSNSKLRAKMQFARNYSRSTDPQHSIERETLSALTRALHRHAPCNCQ